MKYVVIALLATLLCARADAAQVGSPMWRCFIEQRAPCRAITPPPGKRLAWRKS